MLRRTLSTLKGLVPRPIVSITHYIRAVLAVFLNGYPARQMTVIGVTGTDGKTTTSHLIYAILQEAGLPASLISTTGAVIYGRHTQPLGLHVTTPNPFELQHFLKEAKASGSQYIVLEATSHGLAQHRVLGSNFRIGVITNITHEHLDYHGTYERYLLDKAKLFRGVKTSILNRDDSSFKWLERLASGDRMTYALLAGGDITASEINIQPSGTTFTIPAIGKTINTSFIGLYNVQNMLAATAVGLCLGIDPDHIAAGLERATPPPGRLEPVNGGQNFSVFVDFAHTPNSLENMLRVVRGLTEKQLIVVFGCAGDRDQGKRFPMGASAARYCDYTVITAEDPRTESLEKIMDEVAVGCESEGGVRDQTYFCIGNRQEAINFAIRKLAKPGDIVVTTGKAHEQSMCFGTTEYPWDEFNAVKEALAGLSAVEKFTAAQGAH